MERPFKENDYLNSSSVGYLCEWLEQHADKSTVIADGYYTVGDLIDNLDDITNGIWNDGIDAMGEDA